MFQEFSAIGLVISNNDENTVFTAPNSSSNKYFYQYIYDLRKFDKVTNIQSIIDQSNDSFKIIAYKVDRLRYFLIFNKDADIDTITVLNELEKFHIIVNYYFELLYTQDNLIKSVSSRITSTVNQRDLNKMIVSKSTEIKSKEKDHLITLTKILNHADRMNLLLSTNYKFDNNLLSKVPLPKTLLSFVETIAKMTTETTKTDSRMLTNEAFVDVFETHHVNSGFITGIVRLETNLFKPIKDKKIIIKNDKFQDLNATFSDDNHGITLLKKYQIMSKQDPFPVLITYQYTGDEEITLKLNTINVKHCNTIILNLTLPKDDDSSIKVYNQGDLSNDGKTWTSGYTSNGNGTIYVLKMKKLQEMSVIKVTCSVTDGKGSSSGLNIKKVIVGDQNIFKGVKYTITFNREMLIE
ncbi:hypothetical protein QEN19_002508 [Hanseniaspora menglaensis]